MGRLLIDYSKNTAPLQDDGGRERLEIGMTIRYHEPELSLDELDESAKSLGLGRPRFLKKKKARYKHLKMLFRKVLTVV